MLLILLGSSAFLALSSNPTGDQHYRGRGQFTSRELDGSESGERRGPGGFVSYPDYRGIKMVILSKKGDQREATTNKSTVDLALNTDRMGYAKGLTTLYMASSCNWQDFAAKYLRITDTVMVSDKFATYSQAEQVKILVHEFAHHGAFTSGKETFAEFEKQGLGEYLPKLIPDWGVNAYAKDQYAQEAFAYSYSQYMLGYQSPVLAIQYFWEGVDAAAGGKTSDAGVAAVGGG